MSSFLSVILQSSAESPKNSLFALADTTLAHAHRLYEMRLGAVLTIHNHNGKVEFFKIVQCV